MQETTAEIKKALGNAREYLLSHHEEEERHRCYTVFGNKLCARCTGIYPGIALGLLLNISNPVSVVAALPMAATVEKLGESYGADYSNPFRSFTGLLLGTAYGIGVTELLYGSQAAIIGIGLFYGALALALLKMTEANFKL